MSAPLDCQEAKETKEKPTHNFSSCYEDCAYGSQSRPIIPKPFIMLDLKPSTEKISSQKSPFCESNAGGVDPGPE